MKKRVIFGLTRAVIALVITASLMLVPSAPAKATQTTWDMVIDINTASGGVQTGNITATANATFSVQGWAKVPDGQSCYGAAVYLHYNPTYLEVTGVVVNPTYDLGLPSEIKNDEGYAGGNAGAYTPITGTFMVATFNFKAKTQGTTGTPVTVYVDAPYESKFTSPNIPPDVTVGTIVKIYTVPTVDFTANQTTITAGENVTFTNLTTGGPVDSWAWDFNNDGTPDATTANASWNFGKIAGTYTVKLTATNPLPPGSFSKVKANYITVNPGAPTKMGFNPAPASTATAGVVWTTFKVEVQDAYDNLATTASANITANITGSAFSSGNTTKLTISGAATFNDLTYNTATTVNTVNVTATSPGLPSIVSGNITVNPAAASLMVFNPPPSPVVPAGQTWTTFRVELRDPYGNVATTTSKNVTVTPSLGAFASGNTTRATASGVATFNDLTYTVARTITVTAAAPVLTNITSGNITVIYAPLHHLKVTGNTTMTAGSSNQLTITAQDLYGNTVTSYSENKTMIFSGVSAAPYGQVPTVTDNTSTARAISSPTTIIFTDGVSSAGGLLVAYSAGAAWVDVTDGTVNSFADPAYDLDLTVNPVTASHMKVTGTASMTAGTNNELLVTAYDPYGNVDTGYAGPRTLVFSGPGTSPGSNVPTVEGTPIDAAASFTFSAGATTTNAATLVAFSAESTTVDVTDTIISSTANTTWDLDLTVNPAGAATLTVSGITDPVVAGTPSDVTVTAKDAYGNVAKGYTGTIAFTSSDTAATRPGNYPFISGDNGTKTFTDGVTLRTAGEQTVTATDTFNASITGLQTAITVNPAALFQIAVTPVSANVTVTCNQTFTATGKDEFGNTISGLSFTWSVVAGGGTIASTGDTTARFTAGVVPGTYTNTVKATCDQDTDYFGFATVTVKGVSMTVTVKLQGDERTTGQLTVPFMAKLFAENVTLTWQNILTAVPAANFTTSDWPGGAGGIVITHIDAGTAKQVTLEVSGVIPGRYNLSIASPHNLVNLRNGMEITLSGATVDMSTLQEGNADDTYKVDIGDFGILAVAYRATPSSGNWDARADFNRSGQVTIADFSLLAMNFNETSPVTVTG